MELTDEERAKFKRIFDAPSDAYIQYLTPTEFPRFIFYLYERDRLYLPIYVDGPGDGGVDLELHSRNGGNPELLGVVQCKRYTKKKVKPSDVILFTEAAKRSGTNKRYFFTTKGYTNSARKEGRESGIILFDVAAIRDWIGDIRRRENHLTQVPDLPHPDSIPVPVICISNNKGGVAKTTITGNLAAALANDERGVLVIDADPQQHLSKWLTNERSFDPSLSLHAVLSKDIPIHPLVRRTLQPNVWLLPACRELEDLPSSEDNSAATWQLERRLARAIAALPILDPPIRFVLIDTPPELRFLTRSAILASTELLIPLQLDNLSYDGMEEFLSFVQRVELQHGKTPINILGGVATVVDQRLNLSQKFLHDIPKAATNHSRLASTKMSPEKFWCGTIRRRVDFPRAIDEHKTVLNLPGATDAKKDLMQLAKEVTRRVHAFIKITT